jgi:hypothetical protein
MMKARSTHRHVFSPKDLEFFINEGRKRDLRLSTLERLAKAHKIKLARLLAGD